MVWKRAASTAASASRAALSPSQAQKQKQENFQRQRRIVLSLYRSLLRAAEPFSPPSPHAITLQCLLDRSGIGDDDVEWFSYVSSKMPSSRRPFNRRDSRTENQDKNDSKESTASSISSTPSTQQDSSPDSDNEVEKKHDNDNEPQPADENKDGVEDVIYDEGEDDDDEEEEEEGIYGTELTHMLFRKLLREVVSGSSMGDRQMQFPHHVRQQHETDPFRLRRLIQREFRASYMTPPEPKERRRSNTAMASSNALSTPFSNAVRQRVAFWALRRLNEKLAWHQELLTKQKQLEQSNRKMNISVDSSTSPSKKSWKVTPLPTRPASSYLQPGTFLVAHPNLTGYFQRSVICILDDSHYRPHAMVKPPPEPKPPPSKKEQQDSKSTGRPKETSSSESSRTDEDSPSLSEKREPSGTQRESPKEEGIDLDLGELDEDEEEDDDDDDDHDDDDDEEDDFDDDFTPEYGTYGVIVNRVACSPTTGLPFTLSETFQKLPTDFESAFGKCIVRDGGPVHGSLQMMHSIPPGIEKQVKVGGIVLPYAELHDKKNSKEKKGKNTEKEEDYDENFPLFDSGEDSPDNTDMDKDATEPQDGGSKTDTKTTSARVIKFRGDITRASSAVSKGQLSDDQFSFFVGCSSWAPRQLESEIERGIWFPCRAPPELAYENSSTQQRQQQDNNNTDTAHLYQQVTLGRDEDMWLSMYSQCGDEDTVQFARLMSHDDTGEHPLGGACDDFEES